MKRKREAIESSLTRKKDSVRAAKEFIYFY